MTDRQLMADVLAELRALRGEVRELRATVAGRELPAAGLVTVAELADRLGVSPGYVYEHADRLGALRLGDGPKARLRFDAAAAIAAHAALRDPAPPPSEPAAPARPEARRPAKFELIRAPRDAA